MNYEVFSNSKDKEYSKARTEGWCAINVMFMNLLRTVAYMSTAAKIVTSGNYATCSYDRQRWSGHEADRGPCDQK